MSETQIPAPARLPYAFETIHQDGGGAELERLEAQNRFLEASGLLDQLPALAEDARILDLGSGPGYWAQRLAQRVPRGQVLGLDRSPELLEHARARLAAAGLANARFQLQDLRHLQVPEATFDLVFTCMTLTHVVELETTLDRLLAALKPGGWIVCIEPVQDGAGMLDSHPRGEHLHWLMEEMMKAAQARGSDFSVGHRIARELHVRGLSQVELRPFGHAPHGDEAAELVRTVFLPIARAYLTGVANLDERLLAARTEAVQPGFWVHFQRAAVLGQRPFRA